MPTFEYTVDGEPQHTSEHELTAEAILRNAELDPSQRYLIEIKGNHQEAHRDPATRIHIHQHQRFVTAFIGPVPVSRGNGIQEFARQLTALGYAPVVTGERLTFAYAVELGRFTGRTVTLGFKVPTDFDRTPPSGPHISPAIVPLNPNAGGHPERVAPSEFGDGFIYLSRPYPEWGKDGRTVGAYLAFIRYLFATI